MNLHEFLFLKVIITVTAQLSTNITKMRKGRNLPHVHKQNDVSRMSLFGKSLSQQIGIKYTPKLVKSHKTKATNLIVLSLEINERSCKANSN